MTSKIKINQFKWLAATLMLVAAMVMPSTAWAQITPEQPQEGNGEKDNPYKISSAAQLYWFADLVNGTPGQENGVTSAWAVLTADIEVSGTWTPIIDYSGTFDGKGHTIIGLQNTISGDANIGFFASTNSYAVIRNVGIVNCSFSVKRGGSVGGVCGLNEGTIENCYTTGSIKSGSGSSGGGVCGLNDGTIKNCYNTGDIVDGDEGQVGGVCGLNTRTIENCYNTGSVSEGRICGGVCGTNDGTITNCYYLSGTATGGIFENSGTGSAEGKTSAQFASGEVAWLLNGSTSAGNSLAWYQNIDKEDAGKDSYPLLDSNSHGKVYQCTLCTGVYSNTENKAGDHLFGENDNGFCHNCGVYKPATLNASGEYEIGNAGQLYWFAGLVNGDASVCDYDADSNPTGTKQNKAACAVLTANITVNSKLVENLNADGTAKADYEVRNWMPISPDVNYSGTFDGNGKTISGLYYNVTSSDEIVRAGLFGRNAGTIKNVSVKDSYYKLNFGGKYCRFGILCGYNEGTIENCYNESTITLTGTAVSQAHVGGICGNNGGKGIIKNCNNIGKVSSEASCSQPIIYVGGVCGINSSTIENSSNTGEVTGVVNVGGVCGYNHGASTIESCHNTGNVSGTNIVGGVCGKNAVDYGNYTVTITNCYNTGAVSGTSNVGGVSGYNAGADLEGGEPSIVSNCYNTGAVSGTSNVGGVTGRYDNRTNITNCYYLEGCNAEGTTFNITEGTSKTEGQFKSGEVCYLLNGSSPYGEWGQQFGTNDYPVLGSPYKVLRAAQDGQDGTNYWATFSNLNSNAELIDPKGDITVYNATVSSGTLTLAKRSDNRVAMEEGVLLKANCEYLNAKNISDEVSAAKTGENDLVATPKTAGPITADTGCTLYRLTYNKTTTNEGLGFYLGVVGDIKDGSQLNATPGKAYLKVATATVTQVSGAAIRGFAFPGNDGETTGIECITVTDESLHSNGNADGIFDLQGRKVSKPTKGVYINNGKKVIIK